MHHAIRTAAAAAVCLAAAQTAQAQGLFKRLSDQAAGQVLRKAEKIIEQGPDTSARQDTAPEQQETPAARTTSTTATKDRKPVAASANAIRYIDSLRTPPEVEAQKAEYNKFGEVSCNDCEGGIDFDGRPKFPFDEFSGKYNERAKRAGSWRVGHVHHWQGKAAKGTLTVTLEEPVEGFRCRRLEYRLVKGNASASRPSLICFGLANRSSEVENWQEIY